MRCSRFRCGLIAVLWFASAACLGTLPAADKENKASGKAKSKSKSGTANVKALDVDVEKKRASLFKDFLDIAGQYEDAGQFDRAKTVLDDLLRLDPNYPGLKEKIDDLQDKSFDAHEVKFELPVGGGWVPINASVVKGKPVRVDVDGEYEFRYTAKLTADGVTSTETGQDYFDTIPMGGLMAVCVHNGKSGKAVYLKAKTVWTPAEDGQVLLKINVPAGHKCTGRLTVKLSGLVRTE